jgi:outer membrane protein
MTDFKTPTIVFAVAISACVLSQPAAAQDEPTRVRISLGPELAPPYPGASKHSFSPFFDLDTAKGDEPFAHEAADESTGLPLVNFGGISVGPMIAITGAREADDTAPGLREIGTTVELGGSVTATITPQLYAFAELGRGIGGHEAWTGQAGIDYVMRSGDDWLVSFGPRMTYGDGKHARAYFGVTPGESALTGLEAYDPGGGIETVGVATSTTVALNERWGMTA